jgi:hypothetical protein
MGAPESHFRNQFAVDRDLPAPATAAGRSLLVLS